MKKALIQIPLALKTMLQLGVVQAFWYAIYKIGLRGIYQQSTPVGRYARLDYAIHSPFTLPNQQVLRSIVGEHIQEVLAEADEITAGKVRLFGGPPVKLSLCPPEQRNHWTYYEGRPATWGAPDIKLIWEPARFGWVYPLGRAYVLTGGEAYPKAFWENFETFLEANPPNQGPNWSSAQEVALRLLAFLFAARAFEQSEHSTPERFQALAGAIVAHARRIPSTMSYARAQNNNHWISEALGLYAAGLALPDHPRSKSWQRQGWRALHQALQSQIEVNGNYAQHSINYHRLMLHDLLQAAAFGRPFPARSQRRLAAATKWLLAQVDPLSGRAPNLGSNDGAHILPLASGGFQDFRPVVQAAARAFLNYTAFPPGPWDELGLWLGQSLNSYQRIPNRPRCRGVYRLGTKKNWATLRAARFRKSSGACGPAARGSLVAGP